VRVTSYRVSYNADQRRLAVCRDQLRTTNDELDKLIQGPGYEYGESEQDSYSRRVIHEARMYNARNKLQHRQEMANRLEKIVKDLEM
jgi:hypothetical protein